MANITLQLWIYQKMKQKGFAHPILLLFLVLLILLAGVFYFTKNKTTLTNPTYSNSQATTSSSEKTNKPTKTFSMWFDQEKTNLDRELPPVTNCGYDDNIIRSGKLAGFVKSEVGNMKKLEYVFWGCNEAGCEQTSDYYTVFDILQNANPAPFEIDFVSGVNTNKRRATATSHYSYILFRLTDDKGNVWEPLANEESGSYVKDTKNYDTTSQFKVSIGGGSWGKSFDLMRCQEGNTSTYCPKDWDSQRTCKP